MHFIVIERFRGGDPVPVYRRFKERGRMMPEGVGYAGSWVAGDFRFCVQIMECESRELLDRWVANWSDLVDFEIVPAMTSAEAAAAIAPRL